MANSQVTTRDTQLEKQRIKKLDVSLTNFANTSAPQIAAGSVVEVNGSLYSFTSDESISGWTSIANNTDCYIKLTAGASSVTASYTTTPPTWSHAKQGWYDGNERYIGGVHRGASSAVYDNKWIYQRMQDGADNVRVYGNGVVEFDNGIVADLTGDVDGGIEEQNDAAILKCQVFEIGAWNMDTTGSVTIDVDAAGITWNNVRSVEVLIQNDAESVIYSLIRGSDYIFYVQSTGDLTLSRVPGGSFDGAAYDDTGVNRGWVTVWYEV